MIDHIDLYVANLARTRAFFQTALAPLGYALHAEGTALGFGVQPDQLDFWVREGGPSVPCPHVAFRCESRPVVESAYQQALLAGGVRINEPKLMPHIHASYYAAFVRDPDGHNIEFACHSSH
ncbi:MAG: VOC family protein [Cytophagales bacterium]|nr:VOC family protein [Rhizobacter sp.]